MRNLVKHQGDASFYARIEDNVETADFMNQAEEILQVHVLKVHGYGFASVLGVLRRGRGGGGLLGGNGRSGRRSLLHGLLAGAFRASRLPIVVEARQDD